MTQRSLEDGHWVGVRVKAVGPALEGRSSGLFREVQGP